MLSIFRFDKSNVEVTSVGLKFFLNVVFDGFETDITLQQFIMVSGKKLIAEVRIQNFNIILCIFLSN